MAGVSAPDDAAGDVARSIPGWLLDLAWAACWTAVVSAALLARGGIWARVSSIDLHGHILPWYEHSARSLLQEGRVPLWTPYVFSGTPFLAKAETGALYPPVIVLFGVLPSWAALQALYATHVLILTWGMIAYSRHHGMGRPGGILAALLALASMFRGPLLVGVDHPALLGSLAWAPWLLLFWEQALRGHAPRWVAAFALAAMMQWLAGYPDFALDLPVLLGVMALVRREGSLRRRLGLLLAGLLLGAALAAVQLLPLAEAARESWRVASWVPLDRIRAAFAVRSTEDLARTLLFRFGPAALALGLLGAWSPTRVRLAWLAAFLWSMLALNLPFRLLYLLPPYDSIRTPIGWSGLSGMFLGSLAAAGLATMWRRSRPWPRAAAALLGVGAVAYGLAVVARAPDTHPFRAPDLERARLRAADLENRLGQYERMLSSPEFGSGSAIQHGIPIMNGDLGVAPRNIVTLLMRVGVLHSLHNWPAVAAHVDVAALLGIGLVVLPSAQAEPMLAAGFTRVGSLSPRELVLHRPALPRARLVHRTVEATGEAGTLDAVLASAPEASRVAVLEIGALSAPLMPPPPGATEEARIVRYEPEEVAIDAVVASSALLVLTDTFYPGWRATVNGAPAPILRADHAFRGVRLEPGRHQVTFRYAPGSVRVGVAITLAAALITLGCLAWSGPRQLVPP
jgi:hypothetical protein